MRARSHTAGDARAESDSAPQARPRKPRLSEPSGMVFAAKQRERSAVSEGAGPVEGGFGETAETKSGHHAGSDATLAHHRQRPRASPPPTHRPSQPTLLSHFPRTKSAVPAPAMKSRKQQPAAGNATDADGSFRFVRSKSRLAYDEEEKEMNPVLSAINTGKHLDTPFQYHERNGGETTASESESVGAAKGAERPSAGAEPSLDSGPGDADEQQQAGKKRAAKAAGIKKERAVKVEGDAVMSYVTAPPATTSRMSAPRAGGIPQIVIEAPPRQNDTVEVKSEEQSEDEAIPVIREDGEKEQQELPEPADEPFAALTPPPEPESSTPYSDDLDYETEDEAPEGALPEGELPEEELPEEELPEETKEAVDIGDLTMAEVLEYGRHLMRDTADAQDPRLRRVRKQTTASLTHLDTILTNINDILILLRDLKSSQESKSKESPGYWHVLSEIAAEVGADAASTPPAFGSASPAPLSELVAELDETVLPQLYALKDAAAQASAAHRRAGNRLQTHVANIDKTIRMVRGAMGAGGITEPKVKPTAEEEELQRNEELAERKRARLLRELDRREKEMREKRERGELPARHSRTPKKKKAAVQKKRRHNEDEEKMPVRKRRRNQAPSSPTAEPASVQQPSDDQITPLWQPPPSESPEPGPLIIGADSTVEVVHVEGFGDRRKKTAAAARRRAANSLEVLEEQPWTEEEDHAVFVGLQKWMGHDRWDQIKEENHRLLRHRSAWDVRERARYFKAELMQDGWPDYPEWRDI